MGRKHPRPEHNPDNTMAYNAARGVYPSDDVEGEVSGGEREAILALLTDHTHAANGPKRNGDWYAICKCRWEFQWEAGWDWRVDGHDQAAVVHRERAYEEHDRHRAEVLATAGFRRRDSDAGLRERVEALVPNDCWVMRSHELTCADLAGGIFPNGAPWTEDMCCLPCRLRAALAVEDES